MGCRIHMSRRRCYFKGSGVKKAMAVYTELDSEEISAFLSNYALGDLAYAKGIAEGVENTNYLIAIRRKDSETKYILTVYEKRVSEQDLPFFMGLMAKLAGGGVLVPRPIHQKTGEVVGKIKGKNAVIVSFLQGTSCKNTIRTEQLAALGAAQAEMHEAAEGFAFSRHNALALSGWEALYQKNAPRLDEITPGLKAQIAAELDYLKTHWPKNLPSGVIHADLFPDNVFFEGDTLTGIIDFYFACNDFLMYDLVITMNAWCFEKHHEFNVTKARALLTSYNNVRPISEAELEALPVLARGAALRFLLTRADAWLNRVEGALVNVKDPMEYVKKLRFHQQVKQHGEYGL